MTRRTQRQVATPPGDCAAELLMRGEVCRPNSRLKDEGFQVRKKRHSGRLLLASARQSGHVSAGGDDVLSGAFAECGQHRVPRAEGGGSHGRNTSPHGRHRLEAPFDFHTDEACSRRRGVRLPTWRGDCGAAGVPTQHPGDSSAVTIPAHRSPASGR